MPELSTTMTEANVVSWLKKEGDKVLAGEAIVEIETDKATVELESPETGTISKIIIPEGTQGVEVGAVLAILLKESEEIPLPREKTKPEPSKGIYLANSSPKDIPETAADSSEGPLEQNSFPPLGTGDRQIDISPLARRMALQAGLDLTLIQGSGPNGRIKKVDIEAVLKLNRAPSISAMVSRQQTLVRKPTPRDEETFYTEIPHTLSRKAIAKRLAEAKRTVPHFYLQIRCEVDELLRVRHEINTRSDQVKLKINDFVILVAALALRMVPALNASWTDKTIRLHDCVDVSVAVATRNGLTTPIIKNAHQKSLFSISEEMRDLVDRARAGKLAPEEYEGGTFSISNLGMYGIETLFPIINPPQSCILGVGCCKKEPVVREGRLTIASVMNCTLSADHRVIDGAIGSEFLGQFKDLIEHPITILPQQTIGEYGL